MEDLAWQEKIRGYVDLKMFDEAWAAIESLPPTDRGSPEAQELRITILLDRGDYDDALQLSETLCDLFPDRHSGFIHGAYCLHARGKTGEAIAFLQSGPVSLQEEPIYFFNLACYELALGKAEVAMSWLEQSFEMDPPSRAKALEDPDLEPLRERILERMRNA